jgi:hypothetical protein
MSVITWEFPKELCETDFALAYGLEGGARLESVFYDEMAEAIIVQFDVESEDVNKIPDSDSTGTLISID